GPSGNVDQGQGGGNNVQRAVLAQRSSAHGFGRSLIFLVYAVVFFFRAFSSTGFELGVETLNGVTPQRLNEVNPAIMAYIMHLHVATAGFIAATAIAAGGLAWVRRPRRLVVGVDNSRDLASRGIGSGVTTALDGALQL